MGRLQPLSRHTFVSWIIPAVVLVLGSLLVPPTSVFARSQALQLTRAVPEVVAPGQVQYLEGAAPRVTPSQYRATIRGRQPTFYARDREPMVDASVGGATLTIIRLDNFPRFLHLHFNSSPQGTCPGSQSACIQAVLSMLNADRAKYGVAPLSLNVTLTNGNGNCVGAYGHSVHMSQVGHISHDQFPADICIPWKRAGENVGEAHYPQGELYDLQRLDQIMMAETSPPKVPGCSGSHACNIINPGFHRAGIGIYVSASGAAWLTEDFTN
jgi:uncharacterized protein YkwD